MQFMNQEDVEQCITEAVPEIFDHICQKANRSEFLHPVTKVLTLSLDKETRARIEERLTIASGLDEDAAKKQVRFIMTCAQSISENDILVKLSKYGAYAQAAASCFESCMRDGALVLSKMAERLIIDENDVNKIGLQLLYDEFS
jgi:hypothetical protein